MSSAAQIRSLDQARSPRLRARDERTGSETGAHERQS
jgi:hypothetical protein